MTEENRDIAFTVTIRNAFGEHEITWSKGTAIDFAQTFGGDAGQRLLGQFENPAQLRAMMDPRYRQIGHGNPAQQAYLAPHSSNPEKLPALPFHHEPFDHQGGGLLLDVASVDSIDDAGSANSANVDEQKLKLSSYLLDFRKATSSKLVRISFLVLVSLSLGNPQPTFGWSLRKFLTELKNPGITQLVGLSDWINPGAWIYGARPWESKSPNPNSSPPSKEKQK